MNEVSKFESFCSKFFPTTNWDNIKTVDALRAEIKNALKGVCKVVENQDQHITLALKKFTKTTKDGNSYEVVNVNGFNLMAMKNINNALIEKKGALRIFQYLYENRYILLDFSLESNKNLVPGSTYEPVYGYYTTKAGDKITVVKQLNPIKSVEFVAPPFIDDEAEIVDDSANDATALDADLDNDDLGL